MEQRKRPPRDEGRIKAKLDKLSEDIKKLPQERKEMLQEAITQKAYSPKDAATLLGISLMTVRRLMAAGKLKFFRIGTKRIRISADEIEPYTNSVDISTAAKTLGVHPLTIRRLIKSGRLKAIRLGHFYRIANTDLEHIIQGGLEADDE